MKKSIILLSGLAISLAANLGLAAEKPKNEQQKTCVYLVIDETHSKFAKEDAYASLSDFLSIVACNQLPSPREFDKKMREIFCHKNGTSTLYAHHQYYCDRSGSVTLRLTKKESEPKFCQSKANVETYLKKELSTTDTDVFMLRYPHDFKKECGT